MFFLKLDEVYKQLNTSVGGLSSKEAAVRQNKFGKNEIYEKKPQNLMVKFLAQFLNVMVLVLLAAAVISITLALVSGEYSEIFEGCIILFIVIVNATIGVIQENKAEHSLKNLKKSEKSSTKVLRDGAVQNIFSSEIVVGDIVLLTAGNIVPADIRLVDSNNLRCDESMLTGESLSCEKNANLILSKSTSINEQKNMAFSGTLVVGGKAKGVVVKIGNQSEIGKIASLIINSSKDLTPLQKTTKKMGYIITIAVLAICLVIFFMELFVSKNANILSAIMSSVALAVAAIPESLPAVITIILAMGVQQLSKRKVIIKSLPAVETLGSCEIICSDKTGTLTQNKMTVTEIYVNARFEPQASMAFDKMMQCIFNCTEVKINNNMPSGEPTELALYEYAFKLASKDKAKKIYELPFDSNRKMMSTVVNMDSIVSFTKGAFDKLIEKCSYILEQDKKSILTNDIKKRLIEANNFMTNNSLRVIAFCYKELNEFNTDENVETEMTFLGLAGMFDPPRKEVYDAIESCFSAGLKPIMITGDHKNTAFAIAKKLKIADNESQVITGEQINMMSKTEFYLQINKYTVFARVSPEHKVMIVKAFKNTRKVVAMTGDGVNDAPSLKIADIGVGMGKSGTDVVKSVSDLLITDDNFNSIVIAIKEGRKVYANIQKALQFLLSTNAVEVLCMLFTIIFFPSVIFLIPSQILFINLVTDSLPAFSLGVEKAEKDIMQKPPRKNNNIFANEVGFSILYQTIIQVALVLTVYVFALKNFDAVIASTMAFYVIIYMQLLHSINVKTNKSLFDINIFENKTFNLCFVITLLLNLCVSVLPVIRKMFALGSLNFVQWVIVAVASVAIIPLVEIVKMFIHAKFVFKKFGKKNKTNLQTRRQ